MTLKRNSPETPASLDTVFLYRINSPDCSFFLLLLDLCFVVVMKIILSPVFPLCSQEKLGRSLSWHSRLSCVTWLCGQKPCSHGPTRLSFLLLLSPVCLGKKQLLCWQNPNRLLLKGKQKLSQASVGLLVSVPCFLFPVLRASFPQVGLQTVKGETNKIPDGVFRDQQLVRMWCW